LGYRNQDLKILKKKKKNKPDLLGAKHIRFGNFHEKESKSKVVKNWWLEKKKEKARKKGGQKQKNP